MCETEPASDQFREKKDYVEFVKKSLRGILKKRNFLDETYLLE